MKEYKTKDSGERVHFDSGFTRDINEGKPRFDLIPHELLYRLAMLYTRGAEKYGDKNWQKAETETEINRFIESAFRHFMQWRAGEDDEDHAVAAIWNIMAYEWHTQHKNTRDEDDHEQIWNGDSGFTGLSVSDSSSD